MATQTLSLPSFPPHLNAVAPQSNMADSLPAIDFAFSDLRAVMSSFTARFDAYIAKGRADLLASRNNFRMSVANISDQQTTALRQISEVEESSSKEAESVAAQVQEKEEMDKAVEDLQATRDKHVEKANGLKGELAKLKNAVDNRRKQIKLRREYLGKHSQEDVKEVSMWEGLLGLRIEGTGVEDRIRVVFTDLGMKPRSRGVYRKTDDDSGAAWFELDLRDRGWEVVECRPKLEQEDIDRCLTCVREGEDLRGFLAGMRGLFLNVVDGLR